MQFPGVYWPKNQNFRQSEKFKFSAHKFINWSTTKNFPMETLLKMIDSSIKNPREVEYDK